MPEDAMDGNVLVAIAREAIAGAFGTPAPKREAPWLRDPAATFVTLYKGGELRGCIGTLEAHRPLGEDVAHNARAAAFRDPRFAPLTNSEFVDLAIEVSVLSQRSDLPAASEAEAVAAMRPGIDGICLECGFARATFLPQVWENIPDPLRFLSELRRKADLPERFWSPEVKLSRYTVEKYAGERARA